MSQPWRQNENWRNRGPPSGDTSQQPGSSRDPQRQRSRAQSRPYDRPLQVVTNTRRMPPKTTLTEAKLMDELDRAVNRYQKPKPKPSKVNVLGVMWDLDNVNSKPHRASSTCCAKVEHHLLVAQPNLGHEKRIKNAFNRAILDATVGLGEDDLFIMYYTGHGVNYVGKAQWESADYQDRGQQEVSGIVFSDMIEAVINPLPCAVVMLLDCCNASLAAIGADKWILAASGVLEKSSKTNIDNPQAVLQRTFTEDLIEQFTLAADDKIALSLLQLHRRIVYKQAARQSNVDTAVLTAPHTDFERSIRFTGLKWPVTFLNTIPLDIDPKKVCAIKLTATMTDGDQSTLEKFKQWATTNAPAGTRIRVDGIQFEEVKKSFSAVLIFNMHVALWDCLQDHPDITTVALTPLWSARSDTLRNVTNMPLRPLGGGTTGGGENQRPEHRRGGSSGKPSGSGGGGSR